MKQKTPQEKKALSYEKDCRNTYGENDKSSRKNIPLRKAKQNRAFRKTTNQILQAVMESHVAELEILENEIRSVKKGNWKKSSDKPLKYVVQRKLEWRKIHGGKGKTALKKIREIIENLEIEIEQETGNRWIAKAINLSNITAVGETHEKAVDKLKYVAHAAIANSLGFDMKILIGGKFMKPNL